MNRHGHVLDARHPLFNGRNPHYKDKFRYSVLIGTQKVKGRSLIATADYFDSTTVGAENRLGNCQTHTRTMQETLPATAVELVEDVGLLGVIDSLPLVGDAYR